MEKKEELSIPVAGEATGTPPKAETEAPVIKQEAAPEVKPPEPAPEMIAKAEYEKLQAQVEEMKKTLADRKEQDLVADAILKAVERLEPIVKKVHEEVKPKTEDDKKVEEYERLSKLSAGELMAEMLKHASSSKED